MSLLFLLLSFSAAGYAATGSLTFRTGRPEIGPLPRKHLAVLGAIFLLFLAVRFWVTPSFLVLDGNSGVQGIFGFADAEARVPGYRVLAILTLAAAVVLTWSGFKARLSPIIGSSVAVVVGGLLMVQLYPELVQRFQVEPNELDRETPYIEENLRFTLLGFGLDRVERKEYDYSASGPTNWETAARQFEGLPIWTPGALLTTFREVESVWPYYVFQEVTLDRYPTDEGVSPVALAVREIDRAGIGDPNWQNLHLQQRYLAGMGAVASAVNRRTPEGRPSMFLSGIPPVSTGDPQAPDGLSLANNSVYFGSRPQEYAIINPGSGLPPSEADSLAPAGGPDFVPPPSSPIFGVAGDGSLSQAPMGIPLGGLLRKLVFAWVFGDANLLFASEVSAESQLVFRRSVLERASTIAPFLRFLEAPYPVLHEGRIIWILEGFTATRSFPLATARELPGGSVTYLRNSVKVTVDAVTGETRFFRLDQDDPLLEAWSRVFPDLLRPLEEMPEELRSHLRYPRVLLDLQARVLLQYHQDTAPQFFRQQNAWALPQELAQGTRPVPYEPEYGLYRLPGEENPEFLLSTVFVPAGRQNLMALLAARCDPEHYGDLLLFDIASEDQVPGPRQVEALVEQDPIISQEFSLWRQGGSQVWSGHLHIIPVGQTLLYLEAIFLAAEADAIPELRRFVVSDGRRVAMEPTLEGAIAALALQGGEVEPPLSGVEPDVEGTDPSASPSARWPREALDLLNVAEERLREGDWAGFGEALGQLRALLQSVSSAGLEG